MDKSKDAFECRAPQLYQSLPAIDMESARDGADEFFDAVCTPPQRVDKDSPQDCFFTPLQHPAEVRVKKVPPNIPSPILEVPEAPDQSLDSRRKSGSDFPVGRIVRKAKRRSWQIPKKTVGNITEDVENLAVKVFEGIRLSTLPTDKEHSMTTRQDVALKTPTLALRTRNVVRLAKKRIRSQSPGLFAQPPQKYVALAEQVQHFFTDTPPRYKFTHAKDPVISNHKLQLTVPASPLLLTKTRSRTPPTVEEEHIPHVIKARPLNPKILQLPDHSKRPSAKPSTVPQPFNLTHVPKKEKNIEVQELFQFKARPVPRSVRSSMCSISSTSSSTSRSRHPVYSFEGNSQNPPVLKVEHTHAGVATARKTNETVVKPFSFANRDRLARLKKERKIQQIIEDSTKIPKFTAKPVPSFILQMQPPDDASDISTRSGSRSKYHVHETSPVKSSFKAKPPVVLFKEPFRPKKIEKPLTDITEFELNTERRAKDRALYDQNIKDKEKRNDDIRKVLSNQRVQLEKNAVLQLRKSMVPKPTPLPGFITKSSKDA